jgi:hypothetical protein
VSDLSDELHSAVRDYRDADTDRRRSDTLWWLRYVIRQAQVRGDAASRGVATKISDALPHDPDWDL